MMTHHDIPLRSLLVGKVSGSCRLWVTRHHSTTPQSRPFTAPEAYTFRSAEQSLRTTVATRWISTLASGPRGNVFLTASQLRPFLERSLPRDLYRHSISNPCQTTVGSDQSPIRIYGIIISLIKPYLTASYVLPRSRKVLEAVLQTVRRMRNMVTPSQVRH